MFFSLLDVGYQSVCFFQGDQGFPGDPGPQGERGISEPGPKVGEKKLSSTKSHSYQKIKGSKMLLQMFSIEIHVNFQGEPGPDGVAGIPGIPGEDGIVGPKVSLQVQ